LFKGVDGLLGRVKEHKIGKGAANINPYTHKNLLVLCQM
jgi:hypothetical protein